MPAYLVSLGWPTTCLGESNGCGRLTQYPMGQIVDSSVNSYKLKSVKYNNLDIKSESYIIIIIDCYSNTAIYLVY